MEKKNEGEQPPTDQGRETRTCESCLFFPNDCGYAIMLRREHRTLPKGCRDWSQGREEVTA